LYSNDSYQQYNHTVKKTWEKSNIGMTALPTILVVDIPQDHTNREQHHCQCPLLHCPPSTPPLSTINPAIVIAHVIAHIITHVVAPRCPPLTPTIVAQVIAHHHHRCRPLPPSSISSKDDAAFLPLLPLCQTDAVKEIMAKVISMQSANKYAGQNSIFAFFCYKSAELRDVLWSRGLLMVSICMQKKMQKNTQKNAA
jgi:hypothetical protein